ncbi:MAG: hypothetical protein HKN25_08900 [Pyrinomonadaceae bacterium]|nr:hypothetical protein [Pyrinomonadaceae bacterium]
MGEDATSSEVNEDSFKQLSHIRILWIMGLVVVFGAIIGAIFESLIFGIGILIGGVLSFVNYYWLKRSLESIFSVAKSGIKPNLFAGSYILRYLIFAIVLMLIYLSKMISIVAVILGLSSFAIAVMLEGILRIFSSINTKKGI